jgi:flagellar biosynthetic protein FlhB
MGPNDGQERTEEATPRKRQEARRKGTVAKSVDLTGSLVLVALVLALPAAIGGMGAGLRMGIQNAISQMPETLDVASAQRFTYMLAAPLLPGLAILMGAALITGLIGNFAQVGFTLSLEALSPQLQKINPLNGVKRLFSALAFMEGLKAAAKFTLFGLIAYRAIAGRWDTLVGLAWLGPGPALAAVGPILGSIVTQIAIAWLIIGIIDYIFQRKQVDKQLRMSKDEVKREMRESDGNPEIKIALAQRRRKLLKGRAPERVRTADVVVTNPTHFAVAIKYERSQMVAPVVVAKGQDYLALKIREWAEAGKVPIVPNPPLARALYKRCEVGDSIPRDLFQSVAEVLAYVYKSVRHLRKPA